MAEGRPNVIRASLRRRGQQSADPCPLFWSAHYLRHNQRRQEHLASLGLDVSGRSVLEVGAGAGDHTSFFLDRGCAVSTTDGRPENVALLRERYSWIHVDLLDLDDPDATFDLVTDVVYCYGTLYHLRRPMEALAFLAERCRGMLLLETCVSFGNDERLNPVEDRLSSSTRAFTGLAAAPRDRGCTRAYGITFRTSTSPPRNPGTPSSRSTGRRPRRREASRVRSS